MNVIVAADQNWGIGKDNKLLVSIPADMKMFREETSGKVVVMGRKTLESFPNGLPLKNRTNIVITKNKDYDAKGAIVVHSIEEALEEIKKYPTEDVYCIGGDSIYEQMLPYCDVAHVTKIDFAYEADSHFPNLDEDDEVVAMQLDRQGEYLLIVSENGYGKRTLTSEFHVQNRGGKGVKTMNITDKTGKLVTIKSVTDENDLMIINKSGITIRLKVADVRIMGRATQGVRLINLEKRNDEIGSVCKVTSETEEDIIAEEDSDASEKTQNDIVNNENEE